MKQSIHLISGLPGGALQLILRCGHEVEVIGSDEIDLSGGVPLHDGEGVIGVIGVVGPPGAPLGYFNCKECDETSNDQG